MEELITLTITDGVIVIVTIIMVICYLKGDK